MLLQKNCDEKIAKRAALQLELSDPVVMSVAEMYQELETKIAELTKLIDVLTRLATEFRAYITDDLRAEKTRVWSELETSEKSGVWQAPVLPRRDPDELAREEFTKNCKTGQAIHVTVLTLLRELQR